MTTPETTNPETTNPGRASPGLGRASVLFVCVRNGGKSQMAAGLLRHAAPDIEVHSAGTDPGTQLNALSVQVLDEVGVDITAEAPKPIDPHLLRSVDLVITLGREAHIDALDGVEVRNWDTDEPSERGIDGIERMRLVRDDITRHVHALATELDTTGRQAHRRRAAGSRDSCQRASAAGDTRA